MAAGYCLIGMDDARDGNYTGANPSNGIYAEFRDITLPGLTVVKLSYDAKIPPSTHGTIYLTARNGGTTTGRFSSFLECAG